MPVHANVVLLHANVVLLHANVVLLHANAHNLRLAKLLFIFDSASQVQLQGKLIHFHEWAGISN